jgi:hypothetical protein
VRPLLAPPSPFSLSFPLLIVTIPSPSCLSSFPLARCDYHRG